MIQIFTNKSALMLIVRKIGYYKVQGIYLGQNKKFDKSSLRFNHARLNTVIRLGFSSLENGKIMVSS